VKQLLDTLNPDQKQAVLHETGPALVLAGAGSGKTRVLTTRVAWLLAERTIQPTNILLVTFTNKAAHEMNQRVQKYTGHTLPFSGTFHSLSARILRQRGYKIGLSPDFVIYDSDDQLTLIKQLYKKHGYDPKEYNPKMVKSKISSAKNELLYFQDYQEFASGRFEIMTGNMYELYTKALAENNAVDFDDLLMLVVKLLQTDQESREHFQKMFQYILVDEYQDTNKAQYTFTKILAEPQQELFVVGDFAQSIYAWRGADFRNMLKLQQDFPNLKEYKLQQNYRSTQAILNAATGVIEQTTDHPVLKLWTDKMTSEKVTLTETLSGDGEAEYVLNTIRALQPKYNLNDIAVLYRTNAQSRAFEEACIRHGVPYQLVGGFKFYERKEIKDLLAYVRLVINPHDSVSLQRAEKNGKRRLLKFFEWQASLSADKPDSDKKSVSTFSPAELLKTILSVTNYSDTLDSQDPEDQTRLENITELLAVAEQFEDLTTFLENIALVQDNTMDKLEPNSKQTGITLMSLHSAKGLEFPVVFMVGMEEGLLPHSRSLLDPKQLEEERRLCYVGITRAQDTLFLTYARRRWGNGSSGYSIQSRFLSDIPQQEISFKSQGGEHTHQHFSSHTPAGKATASSERRLVYDDDSLDAVLQGELDIDAFLDS
jgi:DNA helicase-2/ATP-dependent DNA helicase PcrA